VSQGAEPLEQPPVPLELGPQHSGDGQNVMPVRHRRQHPVHDETGRGLHILLVARRTKPPAFAGKGQQVLVLAMVAPNPGEPALQIAAVQKLVDHLRDDGPQEAVARLVPLGINLLELLVVAVGTLPERRFLRISGAIDLHWSTRQHKADVCHLTAQVHLCREKAQKTQDERSQLWKTL
jgi:hypothetical protein